MLISNNTAPQFPQIKDKVFCLYLMPENKWYICNSWTKEFGWKQDKFPDTIRSKRNCYSIIRKLGRYIKKTNLGWSAWCVSYIKSDWINPYSLTSTKDKDIWVWLTTNIKAVEFDPTNGSLTEVPWAECFPKNVSRL